MVETFPGCFLCVLPYEAWVLLSRPIIQTLFCWAIQITVHWWVSNVWNWVGGIILPSPRYNTRVLAFSQSRSVDFHSRQAPPTPFYLSQLLHLCSPFLHTQNCLQLDFVNCPKDLSSCSWFSLIDTCCRETEKEWIMSPMMEAAVMADHFDSINKLPEGVAGVPNWRCVPGYQVLNF